MVVGGNCEGEACSGYLGVGGHHQESSTDTLSIITQRKALKDCSIAESGSCLFSFNNSSSSRSTIPVYVSVRTMKPV